MNNSNQKFTYFCYYFIYFYFKQPNSVVKFHAMQCGMRNYLKWNEIAYKSFIVKWWLYRGCCFLPKRSFYLSIIMLSFVHLFKSQLCCSSVVTLATSAKRCKYRIILHNSNNLWNIISSAYCVVAPFELCTLQNWHLHHSIKLQFMVVSGVPLHCLSLYVWMWQTITVTILKWTTSKWKTNKLSSRMATQSPKQVVSKRFSYYERGIAVKEIQRTRVHGRKYGASDEGTWFSNRLLKKIVQRRSYFCWLLAFQCWTGSSFFATNLFLNAKSSHYPSHFASLSLWALIVYGGKNASSRRNEQEN